MAQPAALHGTSAGQRVCAGKKLGRQRQHLPPHSRRPLVFSTRYLAPRVTLQVPDGLLDEGVDEAPANETGDRDDAL